ncbi:MAG: hypothetical protein IRD7MM_01100 [Candidatus Midichloria mitochondrii]
MTTYSIRESNSRPIAENILTKSIIVIGLSMVVKKEMVKIYLFESPLLYLVGLISTFAVLSV